MNFFQLVFFPSYFPYLNFGVADDFCVCLLLLSFGREFFFLRFPFQGDKGGYRMVLGDGGQFDLALEVGHAGWDYAHRVEVHLKFLQIV